MKTRIQAFFNKIHNIIKPYEKNLIFPVLKIIAIIIICAVLVRLLGGNETLSDYARNNPDTAYKTEISK